MFAAQRHFLKRPFDSARSYFQITTIRVAHISCHFLQLHLEVPLTVKACRKKVIILEMHDQSLLV
jgi:hypothetical protein